jgi:hypothetical protein
MEAIAVQELREWRQAAGKHVVEETEAASACKWTAGGVEDVFIRPACEFRVDAQWRRLSTAARVSAVMQGRDVRGGCEGRFFVQMKGSELLHDFAGEGGEGEGLQAACGTTHIAGVQEGVHVSGQNAVRGRKWVTSLSAALSELRLPDAACSSGGALDCGSDWELESQQQPNNKPLCVFVGCNCWSTHSASNGDVMT